MTSDELAFRAVRQWGLRMNKCLIKQATVAVAFLTAGAAESKQVNDIGMPRRPIINATYPNCLQNYTRFRQFEAQVQAVQDCINELELFNSDDLPDYIRRMRDYVNKIQIISANAIRNRKISLSRRTYIVERVREETKNCDVAIGSNFAEYRKFVNRYRSHIGMLKALRARQRFPSN